MITAAGQGRGGGRGQQGGDLVAGEEADRGVVVALSGDGQDPGDETGMLGGVQGRVAEQRVDCGEAGVAGGDAVAAAGFPGW